MSNKSRSLLNRIVAISAIVVALPVVWSVISSAVALSTLPEKVDRIDRRLTVIERASGIYDPAATNSPPKFTEK